MKARLAAMEEEAQKLKDEANAIGDDMNTGDGAGAGATDADKAEADSRSVHCGGVDYATTPRGARQPLPGVRHRQPCHHPHRQVRQPERVRVRRVSRGGCGSERGQADGHRDPRAQATGLRQAH